MLGVVVPKSSPTSSDQSDPLPKMFVGLGPNEKQCLQAAHNVNFLRPGSRSGVFFLPSNKYRSWNLVGICFWAIMSKWMKHLTKTKLPRSTNWRKHNKRQVQSRTFLETHFERFAVGSGLRHVRRVTCQRFAEEVGAQSRFSKIFETWNHVLMKRHVWWSSMLGWHQDMPPFVCTIGLVHGPIDPHHPMKTSEITRFLKTHRMPHWPSLPARGEVAVLRHIHRCDESSLKQWEHG